MHDAGKPATRRFESDGSVSFHAHDIVARKMTQADEPPAPRGHQGRVHAVALHLRFHGYGEQKWSDAAVRRYVTDAGLLSSASTG